MGRCSSCKFADGSECHRHAPACTADSKRPVFPWCPDYPNDSCGDHEYKDSILHGDAFSVKES